MFRFFKKKEINSFSRSLLLYIFLASSFVTLITTSVQLYLVYNTEINNLDKLSSHIKTGYLNGLSIAAWNLDELQAQVILDGLAALPDVTYAGLFIHDEVMSESGKKLTKHTIDSTWTLTYNNEGTTSEYGSLSVQISTQKAVDSLVDSMLIVLISNAIRTFLIASFIFFIVEYLATRHLMHISSSLQKINSVNTKIPEIKLQGKRKNKNEIDIVVDSINSLNARLNSSWNELKNSELNYRSLLENSKRAILILDDKGIKFKNHELVEMFDRNSLGVLDSLQDYAFDYGPEDSLHNNDISSFVKKYPVENFEIANEDGFYISITANAVVWENKLATLLIFTDVTEKKALEKTIKQQQLSLIQSDKMNTLGVMVSGITHQLNNPLHLIRLNLNIIAESWKEVSPILDDYYKNKPSEKISQIPALEMLSLISDAIDDTQQANNEMDNIIYEMKTFIRQDEESILEPISINTLIDNTVNFLKIANQQRRVEIEITPDKSDSLVNCNKTLMNQVLINIIVNAIEACEENEGLIKVETYHEAGNAIINVTDNGIGVDEDDLNRIYDLFYTSKSLKGGSGIGLSLAYSIVKDHKGEIKVHSIKGQGTTFSILLPIYKNNKEPENES